MGLVVLPNPLTDGTSAKGSEVRANDDSIVAQVNGNLTAVNLNPSAAIPGTYLSNVAGSRVPTDRIDDLAVTDAKLRSDGAVDAQRAVTTNHIRDLAVTKAKLSTTASQTIALAQMDMLVESVPFSFANAVFTTEANLVSYSVTRKTSGANYISATRVFYSGGRYLFDQAPTTAIPTATRSLLSVYIADIAIGAGVITGNMIFVSIAKT